MSKYKVQCRSCWKLYNLDCKPRGKPICTICQRKGVWATRDGDILHVTEMADSHLVNLAKFLMRKAQKQYSKSVSSAYVIAGFVQGEAAQDAIWSEIGHMESDGHWSDIYIGYAIVEPLEAEINNRELSYGEWQKRR